MNTVAIKPGVRLEGDRHLAWRRERALGSSTLLAVVMGLVATAATATSGAAFAHRWVARTRAHAPRIAVVEHVDEVPAVVAGPPIAESIAEPEAELPLSSEVALRPERPQNAPPSNSLTVAATNSKSYPPKSAPPAKPKSEGRTFSAEEAKASLGGALQTIPICRRGDGPDGPGVAEVTFDNGGEVARIGLSPPYAGTSVGRCITRRFAGASIPPFDGRPEAMTIRFRL
jgi:hypothetical protein